MNTKKLMGRIHKNAQAGLYSIPKLLENCKSEQLRQELKRQEKEYKSIFRAAEELSGYRSLPSLSTFAKARTGAMIKMGNIAKNPVSKQAEMMILGSTAGLVDMSRSLKNSKHASTESRILAAKLLKTEENNIRSLRRFL